jgi:hypothetical protein
MLHGARVDLRVEQRGDKAGVRVGGASTLHTREPEAELLDFTVERRHRRFQTCESIVHPSSWRSRRPASEFRRNISGKPAIAKAIAIRSARKAASLQVV